MRRSQLGYLMMIGLAGAAAFGAVYRDCRGKGAVPTQFLHSREKVTVKPISILKTLSKHSLIKAPGNCFTSTGGLVWMSTSGLFQKDFF